MEIDWRVLERRGCAACSAARRYAERWRAMQRAASAMLCLALVAFVLLLGLGGIRSTAAGIAFVPVGIVFVVALMIAEVPLELRHFLSRDARRVHTHRMDGTRNAWPRDCVSFLSVDYRDGFLVTVPELPHVVLQPKLVAGKVEVYVHGEGSHLLAIPDALRAMRRELHA